MGPRLSINITEKRFAVLPHPLFQDLQLEVEPSSLLALVGPSGVGKSSLLRMIAGIDAEFSGSILIDGVPAGESQPAGFVFQDARLLPWLTAIENITEVRAGTSRERAVELLGEVGLAGYERAYPHELSGGMQRRVALARAGSVNARFWLFDEPFVSLDRHMVEELQGQFLRMAARDKPTVVLVTHMPEDAARLATRAIVLAGMPARIAVDIALEGEPGGRSDGDVAESARRIAEHLEAHS